MKHGFTLLATLLLALPATLPAAAGHDDELVAGLYWRLPLDPVLQPASPRFGWNIDYRTGGDDMTLAALHEPRRPALLDVAFDGEGLDSIRLHGLDAVWRKDVYRLDVDDEPASDYTFAWGVIIVGALAGGSVLALSGDDGNNRVEVPGPEPEPRPE